MQVDEELHQRLAGLAERARPAPDAVEQVFVRARRFKRRPIMVGVVASMMVLMMVATAVIGHGWRSAQVPPAGDGPFLAWGTAGNAVDSGLVAAATTAWNANPPGASHSAVRVLLVTRDATLGPVVMLEGYDAEQRARLAIFTTDSGTGAMVLRADRPAPNPAHTRLISLVSGRLRHGTGQPSSSYWGVWAVALAMPGIDDVSLSASTVDQQLHGKGAPGSGRVLVRQLPRTTTPPDVTFSASRYGIHVWSATAQGGAIGDARPIPVTILRRASNRLTVRLPSSDQAAVRAGQLAVTGAGLVGRITAVDHAAAQADIELVTSPGFTAKGSTDISNYPGQLHGTGHTITLSHLPHGAAVVAGNRIVTPDPAQHDPTLGAITVGHTTQALGHTRTTLTVRPSADLTHPSALYVMVPDDRS